MLIFWTIFIWVSLLGLIGSTLETKKVLINHEYTQERVNVFMALLVMSIIIFFAGLRSGVSDTGAYINWFEQMPSSLNNILEYLITEKKDLGFVLLSSIFKCIISDDFHIWLFIIAMISCLCIFKSLYKYSSNYFFSMFLFVSSCYFTWLFNGMRQFLVAAILFSCMDLIVERKRNLFIIIVLLLSTIHITGLILIPIYFIVDKEPWSKEMILIIGIFAISVIFIDDIMIIVDNLLANTAYENVVDQFADDDGVNKIRVLFEFIPCIIAFISRKYIKSNAPKHIKVCINMSLISSLIYMIGSVTSGIYIGRFPVYCALYNFILIPWLIKNVFSKKSLPLIFYLFILVYIVFFYYQMVITWDGFGYISDILNINMRWMQNWLF